MKIVYQNLVNQPRHDRFKRFFIFLVGSTFILLFLLSMIYWFFAKNLPQMIQVSDYKPLIVTQLRVVNADGKKEVVGEFFKERRYVIDYEKIPDLLIKAFLAAEDDKFFEHIGINFLSIIRAGIANFKAGHVVQGGSTITQQVAKSFLLTPERSFDRKFKEMIIASRIEKNLTKQQILFLYLNQIYLGSGAYGVQAASKTYFSKDVSELTLSEAALLAGMPQAPGKYSPFLNPKKAKERQSYVLKRMFENKYITQQQMQQASVEKLKIYLDEELNRKIGPYYIEHVRRYLVEKYGEKRVYEDGLIVDLAMNKELSVAAQRSLQTGLRAVDQRAMYRGPLQSLKSSEEIDIFLNNYRSELIKKKTAYRYLMPDGTIDSLNQLRSDFDLLNTQDLYQAVVMKFQNKNLSAQLSIAGITVELSLKNMRWASPLNQENQSMKKKIELSSPEQVLKIGDVVWVRIMSDAELQLHQLASQSSLLQVALEQYPIVQGALISLEVATGRVLAMQGGYSFDQSEFNRAVQALRQSGSAFKPIIYAAALEKGYTPASVIIDSPLVFKDSDGSTTWKPDNFEEKFYGDTTFRQALVKSRNIPTVKIVQDLQVPYLIQFAKRLGLLGPFNVDLSIALGSTSLSLLDLTRVYGLFPRLGKTLTPVFIKKVTDRDQHVLEEVVLKDISIQDDVMPTSLKSPLEDPSLRVTADGNALKLSQPQEITNSETTDQLLDPRIAYLMTSLMKEVVTSGTGSGAKNLGRISAGKTGTTNEYMDAWYVGFTPHVVTGVWIGYDHQRTLGPLETGARAALPVWVNYMKQAVEYYPHEDFKIPEGIIFATIDVHTGKLAKPDSKTAIQEAFIKGTQPEENTEKELVSPGKVQSDFFKEDRD